MGKRFTLGMIGAAIAASLMIPGFAASQIASGDLPIPQGLKPCPAGDPIAAGEAQVAKAIGGSLRGCFQSEQMDVLQVGGAAVSAPLIYAFAIGLPGTVHTSADVDKLFSTTAQQWKDYQPVGKELPKDYVDLLNQLIGEGTSPALTSVKPVLVSMDRLDANSFAVISLRTYALGQQFSETKVNGAAFVLDGGAIIQVEMQRRLVAASDVATLRGDLGGWVRMIEGRSPVAGQP